MRRTGDRQLGLALVLVLVLSGCGSTKAPPGDAGGPPTATLAAATKGLGYKLEITAKGTQECTTAIYQTRMADGRPLIQSIHSCGPPAVSGHPVLIQTPSSARSMVIDVPARGCGRVRAGRTRTTVRTVPSRCSVPKPEYRVTILPPAPRLVVVGIPGASVIRFRRSCSVGVCIRSLPQG